MDPHHHHPHMKGRSVFAESFIALAALVGFFTLDYQGKIQTWHDIRILVGLLGIVVVFYFCILLARAIFIFMTGGDSFWWEHYAETDRCEKRNGTQKK